MTRNFLAALLVIALLTPALVRSADTPIARPGVPAESGAPTRESAQEELRLLEARYGELKKIYARDAEELDDLRARSEVEQPVPDGTGAAQPEFEALRGLLSAVEGQLKSVNLLRQQAEEEFSLLTVKSEERAALAANALQTCTTERHEEISRLKSEIAGARQRVASLLQEQSVQLEIKTKLVRKIKENTVQLATFQSRLLELEQELAALRQGVNQPGSVRAFPPR